MQKISNISNNLSEINNTNFQKNGYVVLKNILTDSLINDIKKELLDVSSVLTNRQFNSLDECWNFFKNFDRLAGSKLYNGFKRLPSIHKLSGSPEILDSLKHVAGQKNPAIIDINCRIDSKGEDKYLFDWHQDYWFSVCSTQAIVVWIPLTDVMPETGGLDLISNQFTGGKIYKTKKGESYNTYADAVKLDEQIPTSQAISIQPKTGDIALFKFNVVHKSNSIRSNELSRFTIQLRFADYSDPEFILNDYKPGIVNSKQIDYIEKEI